MTSLFVIWCARLIISASWTLAYLLIIRRGFLDKIYGIPLVAFCTNISWELIFSFVYPQKPPRFYFNLTWFLLNLVILFQILKYGKHSVRQPLLRRFFYPVFVLTFLASFLLILWITNEFPHPRWACSAYISNCLTSLLFISMLRCRNNVLGQSIYIALLKMLGSLIAFLPYLLTNSVPFFTLLAIATFIFDWIYIGLLYVRLRELQFNPWTRF